MEQELVHGLALHQPDPPLASVCFANDGDLEFGEPVGVGFAIPDAVDVGFARTVRGYVAVVFDPLEYCGAGCGQGRVRAFVKDASCSRNPVDGFEFYAVGEFPVAGSGDCFAQFDGNIPFAVFSVKIADKAVGPGFPGWKSRTGGATRF